MSLKARVALMASCFACALFGTLVGVSVGSHGVARADSSSTSQELRARKFTIVDAKGNARGTFGVSDSGQPSFQLWDTEQKSRVMALVDNKGQALFSVSDANASGGVTLLASENADGTITLDTAQASAVVTVDGGKAKVAVKGVELQRK
jgi:hypothetical protein